MGGSGWEAHARNVATSVRGRKDSVVCCRSRLSCKYWEIVLGVTACMGVAFHSPFLIERRGG